MLGLVRTFVFASLMVVSAWLHASSQGAHACSPLPGFDAAEGAQVVVFGDMHGTVESPAVFARAACLFARQRGAQPVVIGLELPESFNAYFDALGHTPAEAIWQKARHDVFWSEFRDGRHSAAMYDLVHRLIDLSAKTKGSVHLLALARQPIDVEGARLLVDTMKSAAARRALVLIGNAHARMFRMDGQNSEPFARNVQDAGFSVLSLNARAGGGYVWYCAPECEIHPFPPAPEEGGVKIVVQPDATRQPWRGYYYVPEMTLSHPVDGGELPRHTRPDKPSPASG